MPSFVTRRVIKWSWWSVREVPNSSTATPDLALAPDFQARYLRECCASALTPLRSRCERRFAIHLQRANIRPASRVAGLVSSTPIAFTPLPPRRSSYVARGVCTRTHLMRMRELEDVKGDTCRYDAFTAPESATLLAPSARAERHLARAAMLVDAMGLELIRPRALPVEGKVRSSARLAGERANIAVIFVAVVGFRHRRSLPVVVDCDAA